jgi:hypothetical protein
MVKTEVPQVLVPVTAANYRKFSFRRERGALFSFVDSPNHELEVFRTPFRLDSEGGLKYFRDRMKNVEWYVRPYFKRREDIAGLYSKLLVRDKLTDNQGKFY